MDYAVDAPTMKTIPMERMVEVEAPCNCNGEGSTTHSKQQLYLFVALIVGAFHLQRKMEQIIQEFETMPPRYYVMFALLIYISSKSANKPFKMDIRVGGGLIGSIYDLRGNEASQD